MEPLLITAACGNVAPPGAMNAPVTVDAIVEAVLEAAGAGAAIAQVRAPHSIDPATGRPVTDLATWVELMRRLRSSTDIIIHAGVAAMPLPQRIEMLRQARPDVASFLLGNHSIVVHGRELNSIRTRADNVALLEAHVETGVMPDFEIFHAGSLRNLDVLLRSVAFERRLVLTVFQGWDGGEWSPPTAEEYLRRVSLLPAGSLHSLTVAGEDQVMLHCLAISLGGHVRAGLGDYPWVRRDSYGQRTGEWVRRAVRLAGEFERAVATPAEARNLLGLQQGG